MSRMSELYTTAEELCVEMSYGEITMDDAVDKLMSEYTMFTSSDAYEILENVMRKGMEEIQ